MRTGMDLWIRDYRKIWRKSFENYRTDMLSVSVQTHHLVPEKKYHEISLLVDWVKHRHIEGVIVKRFRDLFLARGGKIYSKENVYHEDRWVWKVEKKYYDLAHECLNLAISMADQGL